MVKQLVKIEPVVTPVTSFDGAPGYTEDIPNVNTYKLSVKKQFNDERVTNPLNGFNTDVWLIEGKQEDIDKFIADNPAIVSILSPVNAKALADTIMPGKTTVCPCCGGTGTKVRPAWVSPV